MVKNTIGANMFGKLLGGGDLFERSSKFHSAGVARIGIWEGGRGLCAAQEYIYFVMEELKHWTILQQSGTWILPDDDLQYFMARAKDLGGGGGGFLPLSDSSRWKGLYHITVMSNCPDYHNNQLRVGASS